MARRVLSPPASTRRKNAAIERILTLAIRQSSKELEREFTALAGRTDLLRDIGNLAGADDVAFVEAASWAPIQASTEKQDEDLPAAAIAAVNRALARARRLWDDFELQIRAALLSGTVKSFEAGAEGPFRQIGFQGSFELRNPKVLDYLETRANMLAGGIADTTFDAIRNTIVRGFYVNGKNPLEVAKDLEAQFDFLSGGRARNIARTETLIASEQGLYEQHYTIGVEGKVWFFTDDQFTRDSHREIGQKTRQRPIPIFEAFLVRNNTGGFDEMLHPGDATASPENLCQCRCASGGIVETTEIGEPWTGD